MHNISLINSLPRTPFDRSFYDLTFLEPDNGLLIWCNRLLHGVIITLKALLHQQFCHVA